MAAVNASAEHLHLAPGELDETCAHRAALEAFAEAAAALQQVRDLDELLHMIAAKMCELVSVCRASIHLREDSSGDMFRGYVGHADKDIDAYVKRARAGMPADGITREILQTKAPVIVSNALTDPRPVRSTVRFWNIRSIMAVPMVLADEVIGIVFLDEAERSHTFTTTDQTIASAYAGLAAVAVRHAQETAALRTRLQAIARENHMLKRATGLDQRLTDLVLAGADLQVIIATLAELMSKPCAIHGQDGRRLVAASPPDVDDGMVPRLLDRPFADHPHVKKAVESCEARGAALVGPFIEAGLPHRFMAAGIAARGTRFGTVVAMEHLTRFNTTDMLIIRRAATLIGLHMTMEHAAAEADNNAGAWLAAELIRGNPDVTTLRRRAEHLGVDTEASHRVCLFRAQDLPESFLTEDSVSSALAAAMPEAKLLTAMVGDDVAALVPASDAPEADQCDRLEAAVEEACQPLSGDGTVIAGISTLCREPGDYPLAHAHTSLALDCLQNFWTVRSRPVVCAEQLGPSRLFLASVEGSVAIDFAVEAIGALVDDAGATNLLATLQTFFAHGTSVRLCAERLGVHENTVRYRLSRIAHLTGHCLTSDPDAQLAVRMAMLILQLQGRIDPRQLDQIATADPAPV